MDIQKHVEQRLKELFEVIKLLDSGIRDEADIDLENSILIKAKHKENPDLKAEEVQAQIIEIQKASRRYYLKTQQILQLIPVLSELKTFAKLFNIEISVPAEDKAFFDNLTQKSQSIYTVEKGVLVMVSPELEKDITTEFERLSNDPESIQTMFQQILSRKNFKG